MSRLDRRTLLKAAAVGAGAASWPAWLRRAFAADDCGPGKSAAQLMRTYREASREARPLLAFVIPNDDGQKYEVGGLFGALINYGSDADLAALAVPRVVCATVDDLRQLAPSLTVESPFVVLIETSGVPARVTAVAKPEEAKECVFDPQDGAAGRQEWRQCEEARVDGSIAAVGDAIRSVVTSDPKTLDARAARAVAALGPGGKARADAALANSGASLEGLEVIALRDAVANPSAQASLISRLAAVARSRLKDARVPGSRWATHSGCGTNIEGEQSQWIVACGMGHVPQKRQRFLYLFSKLPWEK